jgi:hypothetical protein
MRYCLILTIGILFFTACKKDKYTTEPQIKFKSISPTTVVGGTNVPAPILKINITDAEGDIGIIGSDTAFIYMKNLLTKDFDSLPFPDLRNVASKKFIADVEINTASVFKCKSLPGNPPPLHTDTLYFEIYVKDFAKNKSNVITTEYPVYFTCK